MADLVLLSHHAGKDTDAHGSAEILCLVEKITRTGGRREQCTVEVLVSAAMKGSGEPHAARSPSDMTPRMKLFLNKQPDGGTAARAQSSAPSCSGCLGTDMTIPQ